MSLTVQKEHQFIGQGAVLATAFLWSTSGLFIKLLDWHPVVISGMRSLVAALFLLVVRQLYPVPKGVKTSPLPFWGAAFANAFTMLTFVIANKITTSANAILLQYSSPVWAALLAWWLIREKPRWEHWAALVMVFGGLLIFFRDGLGSGALLGDGLAVLSGICAGSHMVFMRMAKDGNPRDCMLMSFVISFAISIPFIFLYPPVLSSISALSIILYMGIVQQGFAALFLSYGIKRIPAIQAMLTATLEPLLNPVWVLLIIGEKPSFSALIGGGIILVAVVGSSVIGKQRETGKLPQ
jgi:drug/metabolite transporter (DMT)-like permease